jgi:outer membrane biosynthesis protein TonB
MGAVREPYIQLSGGAAFDEAAIDAVRQYRFTPGMKNGEAAMVDTNVIINFRFRFF